MSTEPTPFSADHFRRLDERPDEEFYAQPRLVTHIDDRAIEAAGRLYAAELPADDDLLDLMSSWKTHLPDGFSFRSLTGLGMNMKELEENTQLTHRLVQNLNREPELPFADRAFGGCLCTVSIQYLTQPVQVFREVRRVLRPGAPFIVTFSNRCFPSKAVALWQALGDRDHVRAVGAYFELSGGWQRIAAHDCSPQPRGLSDPLYAVIGHRAADSEF